LFIDVYKRCQSKSQKTWHSLTSKFFDYMYKWAKFYSFLFDFCMSPLGYYLVTFFTCLNLLIIFCSIRSQLLEMSLSRFTMRSSPRRLIAPPSSLKNKWKRQWSWSGRTTTLLFASTFMCVILPLTLISSRKSKFIMTWTLD